MYTPRSTPPDVHPPGEDPAMRLRATTSDTDRRRSIRALIAWGDGDKLALDTVLAEVMHDPTGVPGLLFELLVFTTELGEQAVPHFRDQLRALLLADEPDGSVGDPG